MCVFLFSLQFMSETFLILRRNERDMITSRIGRHGKYPLFLSDFNETWILDRCSKSTPNIKFHENPPIGSRVVPGADGRKDRTKLIVAFRNFMNVPEICALLTQLALLHLLQILVIFSRDFHNNSSPVKCSHTWNSLDGIAREVK